MLLILLLAIHLFWERGAYADATTIAHGALGLGPPDMIPGPTYNRWVRESSEMRRQSRLLEGATQTVGDDSPSPCLTYMCQHGSCQREFLTRRHLGRHYQCSGHGPTQPVAKAMKRRCNYTFTRKRSLILELDGLEAQTSPLITDPLRTLSIRTGVPESCLSKWRRDRARIFLLARTRGKAKMRKFRPSLPEFPEAELELYMLFVYRRNYERLPVHRTWLRDQFSAILKRLENIDRDPSEGWVSGFCKRWEITSQCRTNKHKESVTERLPQIRKFHEMLIYGIQRSEPQRDKKYGRFPPSRMYHMDQVPLSFSPGNKRSLNQKGRPCAILDPDGSGASKRFCTLQVTICAAPHQPVKLEIYFRGQGLRLSREERLFYSSLPNLTVRFQQNAWADERIMTDYILDFREATLDQGEVLLGMDGHGAQITPLCRKLYEHLGIFEVITPANCTDCISPVDKNVGQSLKQKIGARYETEYREFRDAWGDFDDDDDEEEEIDGDGLSRVAQKRMLVARWASESWSDLCSNHPLLFESAFVKTGFLVAKDGSENHLIELWKKKKGEYSSTDEFGNSYNF